LAKGNRLNPAEKIEKREIEKLIPYARNSRTHSDAQVAQIAASIKEWGWTMPVLIDEDGGIIAGHGRVLAARSLGYESVPVVVAKGWSDAKKRAYVIADNKLALNAGWDDEMLKLELKDLQAMDYEMDLIGFSAEDLETILNEAETTEGLTDEDAVPETPEEPKTKTGDIYQLGRHRLMCGDSTMVDSVIKLMNGKKADLVFTDPPYGISVVGNSKTIGGAKSRNGSIAGSGKVTANQYRPIIGDDEEYDPAHIFADFPETKYILWGANYYNNKLPIGGRWFVWDKNRGEGTTFSDCELAWSNIKGVVVKKYKVTWDGMNREGESGKRVHPTQKPVLLSEKILRDFHFEKVIVDLFGGSGSTLIACEKIGRECYMMELDPKYCDVIVKRWEDFTGKKAELLTEAI
jgi:DNA modification methylase